MNSPTNTPRTDDEESLHRAKWLHKHNAPLEWLILTASEVAIIKAELKEMKQAIARHAAMNTTKDSHD